MASVSQMCGCVMMRKTVRMAQMRGNTVLVGRVPVVSSAAVTVPASQENTIVTIWLTAQMGLMRETAITLNAHS